MKKLGMLLLVLTALYSCRTSSPLATPPEYTNAGGDTSILQSLFNDRASTISEENIQRILDGTYRLPASLRVAVLKLENASPKRYYWNDESYSKAQQSYLDSFRYVFGRSPRVKTVSIVPDLLIGKSPSFTNVREAAVRMQADLVLVYCITSDIYSKYKVFSNPDYKAYATVQVVLLDVRTGLIPFSTIVTKDYLSKKQKEELDQSEAMSRVQREAVLAAINETGQRMVDFLGRQTN